MRLFYSVLRTSEVPRRFGVLAVIICSAAAYIGWKDHEERKVTVADYTLSRLTVDEEQLRQWRGDDAQVCRMFIHICHSSGCSCV